VLPYAAYFRVYEPLAAFPESDRSRWAAYAASATRPRRANALEAEQAEALRRVTATPPIVVPEQESEHAYVRWAEGVTYICPWQTRLRSWLALGRLRATTRPPLSDAFAPQQADKAAAEFARVYGEAPSIRVHIQTSTWCVPLPWFIPFGPAERWLVLGAEREGDGDGDGRGPATASVTRTLIYATTMAQARKRVARALAAVRRGLRVGLAGPGDARQGSLRTEAEVEEVGRWLEEFHPHSLVELDYGGLVHLFDDDALRGDQSVAEVGAAISGLASGEAELAIAMYQRVTARWRALQAIELAN
jgi:hypothetical protein